MAKDAANPSRHRGLIWSPRAFRRLWSTPNPSYHRSIGKIQRRWGDSLKPPKGLNHEYWIFHFGKMVEGNIVRRKWLNFHTTKSFPQRNWLSRLICLYRKEYPLCSVSAYVNLVMHPWWEQNLQLLKSKTLNCKMQSPALSQSWRLGLKSWRLDILEHIPK